jgi:hypothetical protein
MVLTMMFLNQNKMKHNRSIKCEFKSEINYARITTIVFLILSVILFFSLTASSNTVTTAFAQLSGNSSNNSNNGNNYNALPIFPNNGVDTDKAPAFLDAYWTNYLSSSSSISTSAIKKEVGPGDGASTLAIVLVNAGRNDITGVTGYLNLPPSSGFTPLAGENNGTQSVASAYSVVKAGNTFVLYFDMNVLKQAKVGGYSTSLTLQYTKVNQIGQLLTTFNVPFRLTGKVILDAVSNNSKLIPSTLNHFKILIKNKGTIDATGVVATILGITYSNGYSSNTATTTIPSTTIGTPSSSSGTANFASAASSFANINTTTSALQQATVPSVSSIPAVNIGPTTFNVGTVPANGSAAEVDPIIYPSMSAGQTAQNLNIQITYNDAYGNQQTISFPIGLVIQPSPPQSVLNVTTNEGNALIIPAGKVQNMNIELANSDPKNPITNVVATLYSSSASVKVLGDSRWTFSSIPPESKINLSTTAFGATTAVGIPNVFTLTVDYVSGGQSKTDVLNIGSYISGDIKIIAYGVAINYIAGQANIVGNLLNEGNTVGLFTTVELAKSSSGKNFVSPLPPSQYLGDLSVDSPLPFSIPLNINNKTMATIAPGTHILPLKVVYSDDLKISHTLILNSSIQYVPPQIKIKSSGGVIDLFGFQLTKSVLYIMLIALIIVIVVVVIFLKKRKSKSKSAPSQNNKDAELFLDDISSFSSSTSTLPSKTGAKDKDLH